MKSFILGSAALALITVPAFAQQAPKAKPLPKNATELVLTNARPATLSGFELSRDGKKFAAIKRPLEAGKKVAIKLPKNAGCEFVVNAAYADDAEFEETQVNLCADKTVRLTD
jgi:hypothetical protein